MIVARKHKMKVFSSNNNHLYSFTYESEFQKTHTQKLDLNAGLKDLKDLKELALLIAINLYLG